MARDLESAFLAEIVKQNISIGFFVKLEFDGGDVLLWTGLGNKTLNGDVYVGGGGLLSISPAQEIQSIEATSANISLSGIPSNLVGVALTEQYQDRPATIFMALFDSSGTIINDPTIIFKGRMDVMNIDVQADSTTIIVKCENELIDLRRPNNRRYTPEDQKIDFPNDKGLNFVSSLQDDELRWGVKNVNS